MWDFEVVTYKICLYLLATSLLKKDFFQCDHTEFHKNTEAAVQRCSIKKGVLRNFAKFTGKHL